MKPQLVIWGASGHALIVADIIRLRREFELIGFLDNLHPERTGTEFGGVRILGGIEHLSYCQSHDIQHIILGFGNCEARLQWGNFLKRQGFILPQAIHPTAVIANDVILGAGTVVAAGVVINSATIVGEQVILNTASSIDHECMIEDGVHICPGTHIGGKTAIGKASWVGIGATVLNHRQIGHHTVIGAGAVVIHNTPDHVLAYGVPARVIRSITIEEKTRLCG